jgi:peptidoglycan hydrolase CwlO-like protein
MQTVNKNKFDSEKSFIIMQEQVNALMKIISSQRRRIDALEDKIKIHEKDIYAHEV